MLKIIENKFVSNNFASTKASVRNREKPKKVISKGDLIKFLGKFKFQKKETTCQIPKFLFLHLSTIEHIILLTKTERERPPIPESLFNQVAGL